MADKPLASIKSGKIEMTIWPSKNPEYPPQLSLRKSWKGQDGAYKTSPAEGAMYIGLEDLANLFIMIPEARAHLKKHIEAHKAGRN